MVDTVDILCHLACEYNNIIFAASSNYIAREIESAEELRLPITVEENESEEDINTRIQAIEDETTSFMSLSSSKRRLESVHDSSPRNKKRGKYNTRKLMFTNPSTMEREVFTYEHSVWYRNYISDPRPGQRKWDNTFRERFRTPYNSILDLVKQCEESDHLKKWFR